MNIKTQNKRGFTLIELIVVIMLMGIITMIALPGFQSWMAKSRLNGAARQIMSDLMNARMKAASENNRFILTVINNHQYTILDDNNNNGAANTGEIIITKDIKTSYPDVTLSATGTFTFYPPGLAFGATCTVTNRAGSKNITLSSGGRVKIQ